MLQARAGGPLPDPPLTPHPINADRPEPLEDDEEEE